MTRPKFFEHVRVYSIDAQRIFDQRFDPFIDLKARSFYVEFRAGALRQALHPGRKVALVRPAHEFVFKPKRADDLSSAGDERNDSEWRLSRRRFGRHYLPH